MKNNEKIKWIKKNVRKYAKDIETNKITATKEYQAVREMMLKTGTWKDQQDYLQYTWLKAYNYMNNSDLKGLDSEIFFKLIKEKRNEYVNDIKDFYYNFYSRKNDMMSTPGRSSTSKWKKQPSKDFVAFYLFDKSDEAKAMKNNIVEMPFYNRIPRNPSDPEYMGFKYDQTVEGNLVPGIGFFRRNFLYEVHFLPELGDFCVIGEGQLYVEKD